MKIYKKLIFISICFLAITGVAQAHEYSGSFSVGGYEMTIGGAEEGCALYFNNDMYCPTSLTTADMFERISGGYPSYPSNPYNYSIQNISLSISGGGNTGNIFEWDSDIFSVIIAGFKQLLYIILPIIAILFGLYQALIISKKVFKNYQDNKLRK